MEALTFTSKLEIDKDGTWWYFHVPQTIRDSLNHLENRGIIKVRATLGRSTWSGSLLPWADGSAQFNIRKEFRVKEGIELGDEVIISIVPLG